LMLGVSPLIEEGKTFALQTIKDNLVLFTPEILKKISCLVVKAGHDYLGFSEWENIMARIDSFVFESNVHYPTDINLLFDAMRKIIQLLSEACKIVGVSDLRQGNHNLKKVKNLLRKIQNMKHSTTQNEEKKRQRQEAIKEVHQTYLELCESYLEKAKKTRTLLSGRDSIVVDFLLAEVAKFEVHALRQIDQTKRRVIAGEKIPHCEKIFSVFEEHVEWICKGKAGVSQELGHRIAIVEDQFGFIIHHDVLVKQTDDKVAVSMIQETKKMFPNLSGCSFDKGFYSVNNKKKLAEVLDHLTMPKKGKLSKAQAKEEYSEEFIQRKKQHSAVESAINALENHGLGRCLDKGLTGFKRYTALAILARNIEILGTMIQKKERLSRERKKKYNETYRANQLAAAV